MIDMLHTEKWLQN